MTKISRLLIAGAAALVVTVAVAPANANGLCGNGPRPQGYTVRDRAEMCKGRVAVHAQARAGHGGIGVGFSLNSNSEADEENGNQEETDYYTALQAYKGPLWKPKGEIARVHMDKKPPEGAVPCKPPGYDHIVLCSPN